MKKIKKFLDEVFKALLAWIEHEDHYVDVVRINKLELERDHYCRLSEKLLLENDELLEELRKKE